MKCKYHPNAILLFTQRNNISYYENIMEEVKKNRALKERPIHQDILLPKNC